MKQTIQTQLDCRATAQLQESISNDMKQEDGSLASLIENISESNDEDNDDTDSSD